MRVRTKPIQMPIRLRRGLPAFFAALAVGAVAASPAAATFGAPLDLSRAGQAAQNPQVAVDDSGDAVFAWTRFDGANFRVQTRARSAAGVLGPVQTLSPSGQNATDPRVAVDADGDAVFTWERFDGANVRVQARARSAAGALSTVQTLSDAGQDAADPGVAVDASGDAVFAWVRPDGTDFRAQARARSAAGTLSAVQDLSPAGRDASDPELAVDTDGDAVFSWLLFDGADDRAQARARSAGGALSAVQTLSSNGQDAIDLQLAVDDSGDAVFAWARSDGTNSRVQARARSAAGALSAVQTLSDAGQGAEDPEVAVDASGDAVFTWQRSDGAIDRAQARARSAGGALSAVQTLSGAGQDATDPRVAVDASGDAVFAWARVDNPGGATVIQARERTAAGALFAVQTLSDSGGSAENPQVAVDADGDAVSVWRRFDGANFRIQAATGP